MASLSYIRNRRCWRVRWRATNRQALHNRVFAGSRVFLEKSQAVAFYAEIEAQEKVWRSGQVSTLDSVAEAAADYATYCKRHTPRTREHYAMVMARFVASLPGGVMRIQQVEAKHIEEYLYRLRDDGLINRTLNAHLAAIKGFCRWASRCYRLPNAAAAVAMAVEDPPDARFITSDEYRQLLEVAGDQARDRIVFLANTGLRASEFCQLVGNGLKADALAITIVGKGRKRRTIPLNRTCRAILQRPHIYATTGPGPLYQQISRVARRAEIPRMGPHALRHYFATELLLAGVPIIKVSKLLGHSSVKTTERHYAHILDADVAAVTDVLDR